MNKEVAVIIAFFLGIAFDRFYDYLKCEWELKRKRKKQRLPRATSKN